MRSLGASKVALVGASMGGTACLMVASRQPVAAVATLSAPVEFMGLSAKEATALVKAPKLFLAAEKDEGAQGAQQLFGLAAEPKEVQIVPGSDHGTDLLKGSSAKLAQSILLTFLHKNLPPG
jgi:dienelactone hydrolase